MIIKTVRMGIPILVSRSGFTAWGVDLARQVGLTLVGRARGKRFIALSGEERIIYDCILPLSKKNPRGINARAKTVKNEIPPTPGVLLAGGLGTADGRRRQADASDRRTHHPRARDRAAGSRNAKSSFSTPTAIRLGSLPSAFPSLPIR